MHTLGTWSLALQKTIGLKELWNGRLWTEARGGLTKPAVLPKYEIFRVISRRRQMVHVAGM
jgi:hypothetical protein